VWRQPKAAFASVVAFMGIGLVDPIVKPIADTLNASPSHVSLLFTSYMAVMGAAMLITGVVSSRIGAKRTLRIGERSALHTAEYLALPLSPRTVDPSAPGGEQTARMLTAFQNVSRHVFTEIFADEAHRWSSDDISSPTTGLR
jgi:ABC-type transport system involved in cytochrome c biogenesis permease subunit